MDYTDYLAIKALFDNMEERMVEREDAAWANLSDRIDTVKEGWAALQAENAALRSQLDQAGVEFQAALDADSNADADKVEQADAALAQLASDANSGGGSDVPGEGGTPEGQAPAGGVQV